MPRTISAERVRSVVAAALGDEVGRVTSLAGSVANQDFVIEAVGSQRLILKAGPASEIAAESWACDRLARRGIPVPPVLATELDPAQLGLPFLIAGFVAGEPTSDLDVARDLGTCFRRVHDERLPGWGPVVVRDEPPSAGGLHACWAEAVGADLAGVPTLVDAGIVDDGLASAALDAVGSLDYDGPGVLLHNDLKPAHVFGQLRHGRQVLTAVIDWGDASVGDPVADIARLSMGGPGVTAAFLHGYGLEYTRELVDRLTRYRILWNLRALTYEFRAGGDWFDVYRSRISDDTASLHH
jgi:aminoglycoside phosphotransferase (APT) family kinase protein